MDLLIRRQAHTRLLFAKPKTAGEALRDCFGMQDGQATRADLCENCVLRQDNLAGLCALTHMPRTVVHRKLLTADGHVSAGIACLLHRLAAQPPDPQ